MSYSNRTYDLVAGRFVYWPSGDPDVGGGLYPGPGVFGVTTQGYSALYMPGTSVSGIQGATLIVGNALAGDGIDKCNYLDPGDGTGISAAIAAAALLPFTSVIIEVRPGTFTLPNGTMFTLPDGVYLRGSGKGRTVFVVPPGSGAVQPWQCVTLAGTRSGVSDCTFRVTSAVTTAATGSLTGIVTATGVETFARDLELTCGGTINISNSFWCSLVRLNLPQVDAVEVTRCSVYAGATDATWNITASFSLHCVASDATTSLPWTGSRPLPQLRGLYMRGQTGTNRFHVGVYMRGLGAYVLDGVVTTECTGSVFAHYRNGTASMGPTITNITGYFPGTTGHVCVNLSLQSTLADVFSGVRVEGIRAYWPGAVGATMTPISVYTNLGTTVAPFRNILVQDVYAERTGADGTVRVEALNVGTSNMRGLAMSRIVLPPTGSVIVLGGGAGTLTNPLLSDFEVTDLTLNATVSDARIADGRVYGVFTDSTTSASKANVVIG